MNAMCRPCLCVVVVIGCVAAQAEEKSSPKRSEYDEWVRQHTIEARTQGFLKGPDATEEVQVPIKVVITAVYGEEDPANTRSGFVDTIYISIDGRIRFVNVNSEGTQAWWGSIPKEGQARFDGVLSKLPAGSSHLPPHDRRIAFQVIEGNHPRVRVYDRANAPEEALEILRLARIEPFGPEIEPWMPEFKAEGEVQVHPFTNYHQFILTPNGLLLSASDKGLRLVDPITHKILKDIPVPETITMSPEEIRLSPDGSLAAFAGGSWCHVLEHRTWQLLPRFEGPPGVARYAPRFTADGRFLLLHCSGYDEKTMMRQVTLRAYDTKSGEDKGQLPGLPDGVLDYVEGTSGKHAVILLKKKTLGLRDIAGHRDYAKLAERIETCKVAFSPDESMVAIATERQRDDGNWPFYRVRIWNTATGKLEQELQPTGHHAVEGLQWTPDARFVFAATRASSPDDYTVQIWGSRSGRLRAVMSTMLCMPLGGVSMLPDGRHLAVSGSDAGRIVMRVWDFADALKQIRTFEDSLAAPKAGK